MDALASKSPDATLRLRREHSRWADRARMYQVVLDDVVIGDIRNGESQTFQISPGSHRLRLKVDWVGSPEARFHVETGQSAEFVCRSAVRPLLTLVALFRSLADRDIWIALDQVS